MIMKVLGLDKLDKFSKKHASSKGALDAWYSEVADDSCCWKTPQDIKDRYAHASFRPHNRVIFNIKGNDYRLVVKIRFQNSMIVIEWVGTHAEYDKKSF